MHGNVKNLAGRKFERLTVIERVGSNKSGQALWKCLCSCGREPTVMSRSLLSGGTKSCGCYKLEVWHSGDQRRIHGATNTPEHKAWTGMRERCHNVKYKRYADWGGRGIKICRRWDKFQNFLADMGRKPSPRHSLDRKNNNGNYTPRNCRWATQADQVRNMRSNRIFTLNGISRIQSEWARAIGISEKTIWNRINTLKWSVKKALTTPRMSRNGDGNRRGVE